MTDATTMSTQTTELGIPQQIESFLYTPYGLATLAAVSIFLTSLLWTCGCCIYCCYRRRHRLQEDGITEANRDLYYFGVTDPTVNGGTMTSGYNTVPPSFSLNAGTGIFNTSLDSILDEET